MFTINFELEVHSRQQPFSLSKHLDILLPFDADSSKGKSVLLESINLIKGPFKATIKEDTRPSKQCKSLI